MFKVGSGDLGNHRKVPQVLGTSRVMIRRLLYAKEMTFKGKDGSTSAL